MDELDGSRPPDEELVHWCHGAPGKYIQYVFFRLLFWWIVSWELVKIFVHYYENTYVFINIALILSQTAIQTT